MRLEIEIPEHHYNNIMALDSVSLGRVPYKGIIMYTINAIKHGRVLEQEPQTFKWCTDCREYDQEKHCCHRWSKAIRDTVEEMKQEYIEREVLDKIRAEILRKSYGGFELGEGFRDGYNTAMVRVLNILDKYKVESEKMSKHWIDDADHWICPDCGFITSNPNRYAGCKCPKCGFQDEKDKAETEAEDVDVD